MAMGLKTVRRQARFLGLPESFSLTLSFKDPDDETLKAALHQYAKEKLTTAQRLARLEVEHNFIIKSVINLGLSFQYLT